MFFTLYSRDPVLYFFNILLFNLLVQLHEGVKKSGIMGFVIHVLENLSNCMWNTLTEARVMRYYSFSFVCKQKDVDEGC
jgi:hypothetical protein